VEEEIFPELEEYWIIACFSWAFLICNEKMLLGIFKEEGCYEHRI